MFCAKIDQKLKAFLKDGNESIEQELCQLMSKLLPQNINQELSIKCVRKIFQETIISNPLIRIRTCAYLGVRNVNFSENFA